MNYINYESDFYGWTKQQANLLKNRKIKEIDWDNLAEEIEDMEPLEKRQLESRLEILIMHLLQWQFQPNMRSRSWQLTIKEQRLRLEKLLKENPSFKSILTNVRTKIYPLAIVSAEKETGLASFPKICPYELTDILAAEFLPK